MYTVLVDANYVLIMDTQCPMHNYYYNCKKQVISLGLCQEAIIASLHRMGIGCVCVHLKLNITAENGDILIRVAGFMSSHSGLRCVGIHPIQPSREAPHEQPPKGQGQQGCNKHCSC